MNDLSPEDEALIARARDGLHPGPEDHARIKRRLFAQIAAGTVAATAALSTSAEAAVATAGTSIVSVLAKVVVVGVLSAAVVGGGIVATRPSPHRGTLDGRAAVASSTAAEGVVSIPPAPVPTAHEPPPAVVDPPTPPPSFVAPPAPQAPRRPVADPATPLSTQPPPSIAPVATARAEAELLARADEALNAGDAVRALELVDQHAAMFPGGMLFEEREAERAVVLCKLGRTGSHEAAAAFVRDHPRSPLAPRVRRSCELP